MFFALARWVMHAQYVWKISSDSDRIIDGVFPMMVACTCLCPPRGQSTRFTCVTRNFPAMLTVRLCPELHCSVADAGFIAPID